LAEPSNRGPLTDLNRLIKENRVADYTSSNLALGMMPVEFGAGSSRWVWGVQPLVALNPLGTLQGGYLTVFIDELLSTAIASVLEDGEWAMTAEFKINFLRALTPAQPLAGIPRGAGGDRRRTSCGDRKLNLGGD
jgi:acyl-coenzyme A thioesterase PaaI-like protein